MSEWKKYYRSGSAEARPYIDGESLDGVSVSDADTPAPGGMVFRNPDNHADMWYVAEDWFKKNYGDGGEIAALRARVRVLELMRTGAIELIQDSGCFCDCECMHDEPYQHTGECGDICWACRLSAILADGGKG